jgi:hypothetical protein
MEYLDMVLKLVMLVICLFGAGVIIVLLMDIIKDKIKRGENDKNTIE